MCKSIKSCNKTLVKWDVLYLFKLINARCIFIFKSVTENMRFLRKITDALRDRTQHGHVKSPFSA